MTCFVSIMYKNKIKIAASNFYLLIPVSNYHKADSKVEISAKMGVQSNLQKSSTILIEVLLTGMPFSMSDYSNSSSVTTTNHHYCVTSIKFNVICDFSSFNINNNGVVYLNGWIWISDCSCIMSDKIRN